MGLDSVELIMAFEEEFGIEISNADAENLVTPRHVRDLVIAEYTRRGIPTNPEAIFEEIRDITVRQINVRAEAVTLDAHFIDDLCID